MHLCLRTSKWLTAIQRKLSFTTSIKTALYKLKTTRYKPRLATVVQEKAETPFFDHTSKQEASFFTPARPHSIQAKNETNNSSQPALNADTKNAPSISDKTNGVNIQKQSAPEPTTQTARPADSINIVLNMPVPDSDPIPNYSRSEGLLGAWEQANFIAPITASFSCDHVMNNGIESSFVTDINFEINNPRFEYFIAQHIHDNMTYRRSNKFKNSY